MLSDVSTFVFPRSSLDTAKAYLEVPGKRGQEGFVLFLGTVAHSRAFVQTVCFPAQQAITSHDGVGVHVTGDELFRISRWAAEHAQTLLGQMHTHPTDAYHSSTDDTFPLVSLPGAFSVVVPYFARRPIEFSRCACYRSGRDGWYQVDPGGSFEVV